MIETIRPTMSMVKDLLPGMRESWIFNDCAVGERKNGDFIALIVVRIDDGEIFYGFTANLLHRYGRQYTRETLTNYAEAFAECPAELFNRSISWSNIKEGHRYA